MKNFDTARKQRSIQPAADRTFVIGGEAFVKRPAVPVWVMERLDEISAGSSVTRIRAIIADVLGDVLAGGQQDLARWEALLERDADHDPVNAADLIEVVQWIIQQETTFPTLEPSASGDGSAAPTSGESSTDGSPFAASIQPISPSGDFSVQATPT